MAHSIMKGCPSDVVQAIGGWKEKDMIERYKHLALDYMAEMYKKAEFLQKKEVPVTKNVTGTSFRDSHEELDSHLLPG